MGGTSISMAGRVTRFLKNRHSFEFVYGDLQQPDQSVGDVVEFEFLDDGGEVMLGQSASSEEMELNVEDEPEKDLNDTVEEDRSFWENQHQVLQANICRTSSLESRIRQVTKEAILELQSGATVCGCSREVAVTSCRNCLMREVSRRLQNAGYNSAVCRTKWRSSPDIPSGEHSFLDVIDNTNSKKGVVRVMIELNFRAEFEMAKGSEDYNRLVRKLPEVFVGKVERLSNVIKILCMAAKRCMKEKKMHLGPWRKHRYMQAKWLGPCERNTSTTPLSLGYNSERMPKPKPKPKKASMLTVDLLEKLPNMHCTAVEVL
ncbi:uncharacterized protein LOC130726215 [Lotus japonicus]|uniref:uncharacterized protein LOC130726215 n=1 Tax=Lotus japonicus TaxID=34305 RepID=UPI00258BCD97|nr:uncharacterized protein LOC130726215 [Lotus japonicus]